MAKEPKSPKNIENMKTSSPKSPLQTTNMKSSFPKFAKKIRIRKASSGGQSPLYTCEEPLVEKISHHEIEVDGARHVNMFPEMLNINSKVDMQSITATPKLLDNLLYGNLGNGKVAPS